MHEIAMFAAPLVGPLLASGASAWAWLRWRASQRHAPLAIGDHAPAAGGLVDATGGSRSLAEFRDARVLVLVFMSNRCPGMKAYDGRLRLAQERFAAAGVQFVGVNSLDERLYPAESLGDMAAASEERMIPFPYLKDGSQALARAYGAVCTPEVFVLDAQRRLRYRGRVDDSFVAGRATRAYLVDALGDLVAGRPVRVPETPPLGCSIEFTGPHAPEAPGVTPLWAAT